jgi:large subunit ribosomal protein L35
MPKMKTQSSAKKRFKVTATGKVKAGAAHKRHRLISKPKKMKRQNRRTSVLAKPDGIIIKKNFLPYA